VEPASAAGRATGATTRRFSAAASGFVREKMTGSNQKSYRNYFHKNHRFVGFGQKRLVSFGMRRTRCSEDQGARRVS